MGAFLMWDISEVLEESQNFIAVISSRYSKDDLDIFTEYMRNHFSTSGGLIYLCSGYIMDKCLSFIENDLGYNLKKYMDMSKLIFINREKYFINDTYDFDLLIMDLNRAVDKISEIENEKTIYIYITIDSYWNNVDMDKLEEIYSKLKMLGETKKVKFMIRYFMEDIATSKVYPMLRNHDLFLLDGMDNFEIFTLDDLFHKALISQCQNKAIDFKRNKAVMRNEFLESLGEIFGGIVHDMNNLLVSIIGYAQYSMELDEIDEIRKCLKVINKLALDGKRINEKIKREVKGDKKDKKEIYRFDYIINNCIDMVKHKFSSSILNKSGNIELVLELNSNKYIYADEYDLRHSIINIILNGIDAMENGGVITVRTYDRDDGRIVLEISDTGCGMDEDIIKKIFTPYFTTKGSKGTGLGLSIAKRVFEEHNGTIHVESKVGIGTKFTIVFPSAEYVENIEHDDSEEYNLINSTC